MISTIDRIADWGHAVTRSATRANRRMAQRAFAPRIAFYDLQDDYFDNEVYQHHDALMQRYKADLRLPKTIRPIYNPTQRIIEWWMEKVFAGIWTEDGLPDNGKPNMLPYSPSTPEELRLAVQQAFDWSNADVTLEHWMKDSGLYGNVLVEARFTTGPGGEVYSAIIDPRWIVDIELSNRLDVVSCRLNIPMKDAKNQPYVYGKLLTPDSFTTYKNDKEEGYDGNPATVPNPLGFVPMHWGYFRYQGGVFGRTAIDGMHGKIDEVNAVVSQINDFIMKLPNQPVMVASKDPAGFQKVLNDLAAAGGLNGGDPNALSAFAAPEGATANAILQNWGIGETDPIVQRMIENYEKDAPEITLSEKMLDMQYVSSPGAAELISDVQGKFNRVASNAFNGAVKIGQMCCSIGGDLANRGLWGPRAQLTDAQQKFLPFNLDSYHKGELNFSLVVPDLVPPSMMDRIKEAQALETLTTPTGMRHASLDDGQIYGTDKDGNPLGPTDGATDGLLAEREAAAMQAQTASVLRFNGGLGV